jgi:hypothetical protein
MERQQVAAKRHTLTRVRNQKTLYFTCSAPNHLCSAIGLDLRIYVEGVTSKL